MIARAGLVHSNGVGEQLPTNHGREGEPLREPLPRAPPRLIRAPNGEWSLRRKSRERRRQGNVRPPEGIVTCRAVSSPAVYPSLVHLGRVPGAFRRTRRWRNQPGGSLLLASSSALSCIARLSSARWSRI
jgi:hypothetical protein